MGLKDLYKIYGIDYKEIDGYKQLQDDNKYLFKNFIINFYNAQWLEARSTLNPIGIYYVEEINYLTKENTEDDYFVPYGGVVRRINKDGSKTILRTWTDEDYKDLKIYKTEISGVYLRFEYEINGENEWLHVIKNGEEWY